MRNIRIDASVYLLGALFLLIFPIKWLLSALTAAIIHELGHILAVHFTGGRIAGIAIHSGGAEIETTPLSRSQELICALAGPVSGLLLLLFVRWIPLIALCGFIQSIYNLLPLYPLDGGRIIQCALELIFPPAIARSLCGWIAAICIAALLFFSIFTIFVYHFAIFPMILLFFPCAKALVRKIPCKSRSLRVQ